ncbi:MAG: transposase [Pseudomonadota bacterium]
MATERHSDEDVLKLLREIELKLSGGSDVASACRSVGIGDATYYNWRRRFGGMGRSQLSEMKSLEKENARLKNIAAELEPDKLILKESLNHLKPMARPQRSSVRPSFIRVRSSQRLSGGRAGW